jgi:uncharacterized protein YbjQ (UPF0145 family)
VKTKDIASQYGLTRENFESFITKSGINYKDTFGGMVIDDKEDVNALVNQYKQYVANLIAQNEEKKKAEAIRRAEIEKSVAMKQAALANMLITSGFTFDGYTITKYSGYISGDDAVEIPRGTAGIFSTGTNVCDALMASLVTIRRKALAELKEAAYALGCNAVIGVDFDYLTLDPQTANFQGGTTYLPYVFGVTANGNAVVIEKNMDN